MREQFYTLPAPSRADCTQYRQTARRVQTARRARARRRRARALSLVATLLGLAALAAAVLALALPGTTASAASPTAQSVSQPVAASAPASAPPYVVALDAGHGGTDVGAVGAVQEVQLTEQTVSALWAWLEKDPNFTPVLCRENGQAATSTQRAQRAADANASLLLSVHGNSDPTSDASGFECYAQPPGRTYHTDSLRFAAALTAAMDSAGQSVRGESGVRYIYYEGSEESGWEKSVVEASDSEVHSEETFGLLEKAPCPAVLVEQCFLSNADDAAAWATPEGCAKAARAYYEAICAYFGTQPLAQ